MIRVLKHWSEIGEANKSLSRLGLMRHSTCEKSWDLNLLYNCIAQFPKDSNVIDLGCGDLSTLKLLESLGFMNLYGIDLSISYRHRLSQAAGMWRKKTFRSPFHLKKMDMLHTNFEDGKFDCAVSISTIEHGVDIRKFFAEVSRIIKRGGLLFITTDYWEDKLEIADAFRAFDLPWKVFDKNDILLISSEAEKSGFALVDERGWDLGCHDRCIVWGGQEYTFIALVFRKE